MAEPTIKPHVDTHPQPPCPSPAQHNCQNPSCDQPIVRRISEDRCAWMGRKYCCRRCANVVNSRKPKPSMARRGEDRLEDILWMIDAGESIDVIASRIGLKPLSVSRWLRRHGHIDLARSFERRAA